MSEDLSKVCALIQPSTSPIQPPPSSIHDMCKLVSISMPIQLPSRQSRCSVYSLEYSTHGRNKEKLKFLYRGDRRVPVNDVYGVGRKPLEMKLKQGPGEGRESAGTEQQRE